MTISNKRLIELSEKELLNVRKIPGTINEYVSKDGDVYCYMPEKNKFFKRALYQHTTGYMYNQNIKFKDKKLFTSRVHRLVALAWIPNPENLPYVRHKNNIKHDNRVSNLYWTDSSENTLKAIKDGLLGPQKKGYSNHMAAPVFLINKDSKEIFFFGSTRELNRKNNIYKWKTSYAIGNNKIKTTVKKNFEIVKALSLTTIETRNNFEIIIVNGVEYNIRKLLETQSISWDEFLKRFVLRDDDIV